MQTRDITGREINEKKIAPYEKKKKKKMQKWKFHLAKRNVLAAE